MRRLPGRTDDPGVARGRRGRSARTAGRSSMTRNALRILRIVASLGLALALALAAAAPTFAGYRFP